MSTRKIALLGYGTVGYGVADVICANAEHMLARVGFAPEIKYICDIADFTGDKNEHIIIKDFALIENDPEVELLVECIGGLNPAYPFVKRALLCGKSVVTSNKELVAAHGAELLQIAAQKGVKLLFEAAVAGGTPLLYPLHRSLAANHITGIFGILNGTTNFILSKMKNENMSFDDALKLAQDLGFAETIDPSADTEGHDACRKICILAGMAFGCGVLPQWVPTTGITKVSLRDIAAAHAMDGEIKLIAHAMQLDGGIDIGVQPSFVPHTSLLSGVEEAFNGISMIGDMVGEVFFYGQGAGKLPTASAVVADALCALQGDGPDILWSEPDQKSLCTDDTAVYMVVAAKGEDLSFVGQGTDFEQGVCAVSKPISRKVLWDTLQAKQIKNPSVLRVM